MGIERLRERYFGAPTRVSINPEASLVGTTPVRILGYRPKRTMALVVNLSTNTVYIGFDSEVSSSRGIPVASSGGSVGFTYQEDGDLVGQAMYAVATGADSRIYVVEVYLE
jgi:hypothetical protein